MDQSSLKIVVEGPSDAQIIRAILGDELARQLRFFATQGRAALATIGRNILVHEGGPVLIVMDSDTLNPQMAAESQAMVMAALGGAIGSRTRAPAESADSSEYRVFAFVPEIEVVFFEAPQALEQLLGKKVPRNKLREGELLPKRVLAELMRSAKPPLDVQTLFASIDTQFGGSLASGGQAKALVETVESMLVFPAKA